MANSLPIIDADAHVIETERTFRNEISPEAFFH
jgi:hypothetical protein